MVKIKPTHHLVGFCDLCERYWQFIKGIHRSECPECRRTFSYKIGFQLTTYRAFKDTNKIFNNKIDLTEMYEKEKQ